MSEYFLGNIMKKFAPIFAIAFFCGHEAGAIRGTAQGGFFTTIIRSGNYNGGFNTTTVPSRTAAPFMFPSTVLPSR